MKTLKVVLLTAVIALGVAGTAKAAHTTCCPSADCCASCDACKYDQSSEPGRGLTTCAPFFSRKSPPGNANLPIGDAQSAYPPSHFLLPRSSVFPPVSNHPPQNPLPKKQKARTPMSGLSISNWSRGSDLRCVRRRTEAKTRNCRGSFQVSSCQHMRMNLGGTSYYSRLGV
jgi:hypothetical protein